MSESLLHSIYHILPRVNFPDVPKDESELATSPVQKTIRLKPWIVSAVEHARDNIQGNNSFSDIAALIIEAEIERQLTPEVHVEKLRAKNRAELLNCAGIPSFLLNTVFIKLGLEKIPVKSANNSEKLSTSLTLDHITALETCFAASDRFLSGLTSYPYVIPAIVHPQQKNIAEEAIRATSQNDFQGIKSLIGIRSTQVNVDDKLYYLRTNYAIDSRCTFTTYHPLGRFLHPIDGRCEITDEVESNLMSVAKNHEIRHVRYICDPWQFELFCRGDYLEDTFGGSLPGQEVTSSAWQLGPT